MKSEISKVFAELRKFGFLVFNFNSDRKLNRGKMTGFVDHLIIGRNGVWFVEVKIGKDTLSEEQLDLLTRLKILENRSMLIHWFLITDIDSAQKLQEIILRQT